MNQEKILVAHPGRQHSFRVADALFRYGMLDKYVTTVYDRDSFIMRMVKGLLHGKELRRANRRRIANLPDDEVVQLCEFRGLLLLLILRLDKKGRISRRFMERTSVAFQKKLARYIIHHGIAAVISYDTNSSVLFDILIRKAPHVVRIMDNAQTSRNYLYKVYNEQMDSCKEFTVTLEACGYLLDKQKAEKFGDEAKRADLHIVASSFSKEAVKFNGFDEGHIIAAPYGVEHLLFKPFLKDYSNTLKVLFVGEINQRKGIRQILMAAKIMHEQGRNIEFNLVGSGAEPKEIYTPYEEHVNFLGPVFFEELARLYGTSHVFVFPSMGEGFGLVLLEALAAGLPLITSRNCAGPDIIQEGYNGFLIDAGSTSQLVEKLDWFLGHMELLPQFQANAMASVAERTWEMYEEILTSELTEKIQMVVKEKQSLKKV